jgi:hypothetical protein
VGHTSDSYICIRLNNAYPIIGERTMVFIPNIFDYPATVIIKNFTGIIRFHYVDYDVKPGCYIVSRKVSYWSLRYIVYSFNRFGYSWSELQTMWNYIYPGQRPQNKFLFYIKSSPEKIYRFDIHFDGTNHIEAGSYSWLRVSDTGPSLRHA